MAYSIYDLARVLRAVTPVAALTSASSMMPVWAALNMVTTRQFIRAKPSGISLTDWVFGAIALAFKRLSEKVGMGNKGNIPLRGDVPSVPLYLCGTFPGFVPFVPLMVLAIQKAPTCRLFWLLRGFRALFGTPSVWRVARLTRLFLGGRRIRAIGRG